MELNENYPPPLQPYMTPQRWIGTSVDDNATYIYDGYYQNRP